MEEFKIGEMNGEGLVLTGANDVIDLFGHFLNVGYTNIKSEHERDDIVYYLQTLDLANMGYRCIQQIRYGLESSLDVREYAEMGDWKKMQDMREKMEEEMEDGRE
jgi:Ca2+-binding EF-hand superfamily protein